MALTVPSQKRWPSGNHGLAENVHVQEVSHLHMDIWVISHGYVKWPEGRVWFVLVHHFFGAKIGHSKTQVIILHSIRYVRYVPQFWGYTFLDRFLVPFLMAPTLKADDVATLAFAKSEVRKHDPKMALRLTPVNRTNSWKIWRASTIPDVMTPSAAERPTRLWRLLGRRFLRSRCRTRLSCDPLAKRWGLVRFVPKTDWKKNNVLKVWLKPWLFYSKWSVSCFQQTFVSLALSATIVGG
jgi:hypothetical protein